VQQFIHERCAVSESSVQRPASSGIRVRCNRDQNEADFDVRMTIVLGVSIMGAVIFDGIVDVIVNVITLKYY